MTQTEIDTCVVERCVSHDPISILVSRPRGLLLCLGHNYLWALPVIHHVYYPSACHQIAYLSKRPMATFLRLLSFISKLHKFAVQYFKPFVLHHIQHFSLLSLSFFWLLLKWITSKTNCWNHFVTGYCRNSVSCTNKIVSFFFLPLLSFEKNLVLF